MPAAISLIVGLGNPGAEYDHSRHNTGVDMLMEIARKYSADLRADSKYKGMLGECSIKGEKVRLLFPTTYMNESGRSVAALANFYRIPAENILVIHDDLDLVPGALRLRKGGGDGGHNGLNSIIACLGGNKNFCRLRVGIGHPADRSQVIGHVLGKRSREEAKLFDAAAEEVLQNIETLVKAGPDLAMNRINAFRPASAS